EIPHYEKMLEDNAELLAVYAEAHRSFPTGGYDRVVRDVIRWMDAVLWQPDKKLWAGSQDADEHYYTLDSVEERAKHDAPFVDRTAYTGWNALAASAYWAAWAATGARILRPADFSTRRTAPAPSLAALRVASGRSRRTPLPPRGCCDLRHFLAKMSGASSPYTRFAASSATTASGGNSPRAMRT